MEHDDDDESAAFGPYGKDLQGFVLATKAGAQ